MAEILRMPALSPTMEEGAIQEWLVGEGDNVAAGQVLANIETDKAIMEMPSPKAGVLGPHLLKCGASAPVGAPIGVLLQKGESFDPSAIPSQTSEKTPEESNPVPDAKTQEIKATPPSNGSSVLSSETKRNFASPLARRVAREKGVDLRIVRGSGPHGRIVLKDVEAAAVEGPREMTREEPSLVPFTLFQKAIIKHMEEAKRGIPHFYISKEATVDALLQLRKSINSALKDGTRISVNDMIVKACGLALAAIPEANVSYRPDGLLRYHDADIAVAVAVEDKLYTPVVHSVQRLSLAALSTITKKLVNKAREGRLLPEEYAGGSFTISNMGMLGVDSFQAILNAPQAMILAVGAAKETPIVRDQQVVAAQRMNLTISADHRIINGAVGAKFLNLIVEMLENPVSILV